MTRSLHEWFRTIGILLITVAAIGFTLQYCGLIITKAERQKLNAFEKMMRDIPAPPFAPPSNLGPGGLPMPSPPPNPLNAPPPNE